MPLVLNGLPHTLTQDRATTHPDVRFASARDLQMFSARAREVLIMVDIFTAKEGALSLDDIRMFLALDSPRDQRPKEGVVIDYKSEQPSHLPKLIAAFANTDGGIAFLGVKEEQGVPVDLPGCRRTRSDLKTAISGTLRSNFHPPYPDVEVIVIAVDKDHDVALVRVTQGDDPPYQLQNGVVYRRVLDQSVPARISEILSLAQRRSTHARSSDDDAPSTWIQATADDGRLARSETFLRIWTVPFRDLPMRVDRRVEKQIERRITAAFDVPFAAHHRRGNNVEWRHYDAECDVDQRFEVMDDGRLCHVTQPLRGGTTHLVPAIHAMARFLKCASELYEACRYHGRVTLAFEVSTGASDITGDPETSAASLGVHAYAPERVSHAGPILFTLTVEALARPIPLVADALFQQLQEERGASIDFADFHAAVRTALDDQLSSLSAAPVAGAVHE